MRLSDVDFKKRMKLFFSSLFSRKMPFVVFGCPDYKDNQLLYSNLPLDVVELYEPKAEYYLHKVTIHDSDFIADLYERFPLLQQGVVLLNMRDFLGLANKAKGLEQLCLVSRKDGNNVNIWLQLLGITDHPLQEVLVGMIISVFQANLYNDLFSSGRVLVDDPYEQPLTQNDIINSETCPVTYLSIYDHGFESYQPIRASRATVQEGSSFICFKEYLKNSKEPDYTFKLRSGTNDRAAKLEFEFVSNDVSIISVQPAGRWYTEDVPNPTTN